MTTMATFAFFDVDGTLIDEGAWNILLTHLDIGKSGKRRVYVDVVPVWLASKARLASEAQFRQRWIRAVASRLSGWTRARTSSLFDWLVNEQIGDAFHADVLARLRDHLAQGDHVVLVSGMYQEIVERFAACVGATAALGSVLGYSNDVCAGTIIGEGCIGTQKPEFIQHYLRERGLTPDLSACYAYADSYSDVALLSSVGHPVATHPDDEVRVYAAAHGWEIFGS
jgi:HAD superfamily hydrolase (TIGR01490 family)